MSVSPVARIYVTHNSPDRVAVQIPDTKYEIYLRPLASVLPSPQGRTTGVIRCDVWKVDFVSAGGSYVEPLVGRPRRIQGRAVGALGEGNALVVEVKGVPFVGDLPERWNAGDIAPGTPVALDIRAGATFEPAAAPAAV